THGSPLGVEEIAGARAKLGWPHPPFEVPTQILSAWRSAGAQGAAANKAWKERVAALDTPLREEFQRLMRGDLPAGWENAIQDVKRKASADAPKVATRQSSQTVLDALAGVIPELLGGSADLTGSNNTKAVGMQPVNATDYG